MAFRLRFLLLAMGCAACTNTSTYTNFDLGGTTVSLSASQVPADGNHTIDVTVSLRQSSGAALAGLRVVLSAGVCPVQQAQTVTNQQGSVSGKVRSQVVTRCQLSATVSNGDFVYVVPESPVLQFTPLATQATQLGFVPLATLAAGKAFNVTVLALDAQGAVDPNYNGTVSLSSDDPNAVLPPPYAWQPDDHGTHTFLGLVAFRAGSTTLMATSADSTPLAGQVSLPIQGGDLARYTFDGLPAQATAGVTFGGRLLAYDAFGNLAAPSTASVQLRTDDPNVAESQSVLFENSATASFTTTLLSSGARTLFLDASSASPAPATVQVLPARPAVLRVLGPAHASSTLPTAFTVGAYDLYGNVATSYAGTVHFASSDASATLPADYAFTAADAGLHNFAPGAILVSPGAQSLDANDAALPTASLSVQVFNVTSIAAGVAYQAGGNGALIGQHACAILSDQTLKCWGYNNQGQLGLGDVRNRGGSMADLGANLPVVALGSGRTAKALALGGSVTCAVLDDATLKCWGLNADSQLGLGDSVNRGNGPNQMGDQLPAVGTGGGVKTMATSGIDTFSVGLDGSLQSWGYGWTCIQLGNNGCGSNTPEAVPVSGAIQVAAGVWTGLALFADGTVRGWGDNWTGQLGLGYGSKSFYPDNPINFGTGRTATAVVAQNVAYCALLDDHSVKCWGYNAAGNLGVGDTQVRGANNDMGDSLPPVNLGTGRSATSIVPAEYGACALLDTGDVKCWGRNESGQLGQGDTQWRGGSAASMGDGLPAVSLGAGRTAIQLAGGSNFVCALLDNHLVKCWGNNVTGSLAVGDTQNRGDAPGTMGDALPYAKLW